jgi:hypothetical protein
VAARQALGLKSALKAAGGESHSAAPSPNDAAEDLLRGAEQDAIDRLSQTTKPVGNKPKP